MPDTQLILALDAMGVLYQAADDVIELLVPFVRARTQVTAEQRARD